MSPRVLSVITAVVLGWFVWIFYDQYDQKTSGAQFLVVCDAYSDEESLTKAFRAIGQFTESPLKNTDERDVVRALETRNLIGATIKYGHSNVLISTRFDKYSEIYVTSFHDRDKDRFINLAGQLRSSGYLVLMKDGSWVEGPHCNTSSRPRKVDSVSDQSTSQSGWRSIYI